MATFKAYCYSIGVGVLLLAASGCSDPADKVPKSAGTTPQSTSNSPATSASARAYTIRPGSKIQFVGSKVTGSHNGGFTNFSGTLRVDQNRVQNNQDIQIDMKSLWADDPKLSGHLRSPDFFDVEKFPSATFVTTGIEGDGDQSKVTGNLTLHGVTKSISFPAAIQVTADALAVKADFAINRKDFNITYPGKPDDLIRDNVVIKLDLQATP